LKFFNSVLQGLQAGGRGREQGLFKGGPEQTAAAPMLVQLMKICIFKKCKGIIFFKGRRYMYFPDFPFLEAVRYLVLNIFWNGNTSMAALCPI
jgi:hypothetical protein